MGNTKPIGVAYADQDLDGSTISNSTLNNVTIGSSTPGAGTFSTVTASTGVRAGAASAPISAGAVSVNQFYTTATNTTGDHRGIYARTNFTGAGGSGETLRAFTTVAAAVATGGTVNGAHISMSVNTGGSISGAGNALRATLGIAASVSPGGTLAALQVDSDFNNTGTVPASAAAIRITNSNTKIFPNLLHVPAPAAGGVLRAVVGTPTQTHTMPVYGDNGTVYYIMVSTTA
jgi:hypothetical protein